MSARSNVIAIKVSVPSRGNGVIDTTCMSFLATSPSCFRPLSGKWGYRSSAWCQYHIFLVRLQFPSPLGEMGLSIRLAPHTRPCNIGFRPLSGKWGYRSNVIAIKISCAQGFRPLSGKWGYRFGGGRKLKQFIVLVSVPSRGNGVIDWFSECSIYESRTSFRPLSGKWGYR